MLDKQQAEMLISRIKRELDSPVSVKTNAFGAKTIDTNAYRLAAILNDTKTFLEELIKE